MQKMIAIYHDNDIDMLNLGCNLTSPANLWLYKPNEAKIYPIMEPDESLREKIRKDVVGDPSIVSTRKAVVDKTFIQKSTSIRKSKIGIGACQLYPYSMCHPKPTGLYTPWDLDSETGRFTPSQNKTRIFEFKVKSNFQRTRPECKSERFYTTSRQKKSDCFSVHGFWSHCSTVFEAMGCFYLFCDCQEVRPSLTEKWYQAWQ